jgi:YD repeat-containing protein
VQGLDYAYTLQGWLKAVNDNKAQNDLWTSNDLGSLNGVSPDVFGFSLHYYQQDYRPIGNIHNPNFHKFDIANPSNALPNLYNGNIAGMVTTIPAGDVSHKLSPLVMKYQYDQLNRLIKSESMLYNASTQNFAPSPDQSYNTQYTYDLNGNLLTQDRKGTALANSETINYHYDIQNNNQLKSISVGNTTSLYTYDAIGNLTKDPASHIDHIDWNMQGKIRSITKSLNQGGNLSFGYDASGNRISKTVTSSTGTTQIYVRDASGNVMAIYEQKPNEPTFGLKEIPLYGSSRLGISKAQPEPTAQEHGLYY